MSEEVGVSVGVPSGACVGVGVGVGELTGLGVLVGLGVFAGVGVLVEVGVFVGIVVGVEVGVSVGTEVSVGVGVSVPLNAIALEAETCSIPTGPTNEKKSNTTLAATTIIRRTIFAGLEFFSTFAPPTWLKRAIQAHIYTNILDIQVFPTNKYKRYFCTSQASR